jgi:hypothetical protein
MSAGSNAFKIKYGEAEIKVIPEVKGLTTDFKVELPSNPLTIEKMIDDNLDVWQQTDGKKSAIANILGSLIEVKFM